MQGMYEFYKQWGTPQLYVDHGPSFFRVIEKQVDYEKIKDIWDTSNLSYNASHYAVEIEFGPWFIEFVKVFDCDYDMKIDWKLFVSLAELRVFLCRYLRDKKAEVELNIETKASDSLEGFKTQYKAHREWVKAAYR